MLPFFFHLSQAGMQSQGTADRASLIHTPAAGALGTGYEQLVSLGPVIGGQRRGSGCHSLILGKQIPSVHLVETGQWHIGFSGDDAALISISSAGVRARFLMSLQLCRSQKNQRETPNSCCRIIWATQAREEKPEAFIKAIMPVLQQPPLGKQRVHGTAVMMV